MAMMGSSIAGKSAWGIVAVIAAVSCSGSGCAGRFYHVQAAEVPATRIATTRSIPPRRRRIEAREESIKLVLTPQSIELTGTAKQSFISLFDEAMENFVGLQQLLSWHVSSEVEVEAVSSAIESQIIDSIFVLGAASSNTRSRSRGLLDGVSSGTVVSSLDVVLSTAVSLLIDAEDNLDPPNLKKYVVDFFSESGDTSTSFVEAARHIRDEKDDYPLAGLQAIGVDKSSLYDSPFSYLDSSVQETMSTSDTNINNVPSNRVSGATAQDMNAQTSTPGSNWLWFTIAGAGVAVLVIAGLAVALVRKRRREVSLDTTGSTGDRVKQRQQLPVQSCAVPLSVLNCNVPSPTSPVSFDLGKDLRTGALLGYGPSGSTHGEREKTERYAVFTAAQAAQVPTNTGTATAAGTSTTSGKGTPISASNAANKASWADAFSSFARFTGLPVNRSSNSCGEEGGQNVPIESTDEDSKGNEIPKLSLPPKTQRRHSLAKQKEGFVQASSRSSSSSGSHHMARSQRSAVDTLLGSSGRKKRTTPKDGRHALHITSDDLYVIPEDDAGL